MTHPVIIYLESCIQKFIKTSLFIDLLALPCLKVKFNRLSTKREKLQVDSNEFTKVM